MSTSAVTSTLPRKLVLTGAALFAGAALLAAAPRAQAQSNVQWSVSVGGPGYAASYYNPGYYNPGYYGPAYAYGPAYVAPRTLVCDPYGYCYRAPVRPVAYAPYYYPPSVIVGGYYRPHRYYRDYGRRDHGWRGHDGRDHHRR